MKTLREATFKAEETAVLKGKKDELTNRRRACDLQPQGLFNHPIL